MRMNPAYDPKAPKRATNLSINSDLLTMARELDINLSATMERALATAVTAKQRERWIADDISMPLSKMRSDPHLGDRVRQFPGNAFERRMIGSEPRLEFPGAVQQRLDVGVVGIVQLFEVAV
jgi:antitoxin CcdA